MGIDISTRRSNVGESSELPYRRNACFLRQDRGAGRPPPDPTAAQRPPGIPEVLFPADAGQLHDFAAVVVDDEYPVLDRDLRRRRECPSPAPFESTCRSMIAKSYPSLGLAPGTPAPSWRMGLSATIVSNRPLSVGRSMVSRVGVGDPPPTVTEPVGATPVSALRSAAVPPLLNAARNLSASACGIFRSTTIVTGADAAAPPAVLIDAVAVNVSDCACVDSTDGCRDCQRESTRSKVLLQHQVSLSGHCRCDEERAAAAVPAAANRPK